MHKYLHTYLCNVVSPAGHQLQERGTSRLQVPTTRPAKSRLNTLFAEKLHHRRARRRGTLESGLRSSYRSIISELSSLR